MINGLRKLKDIPVNFLYLTYLLLTTYAPGAP